ncbi:hypothetical protein R84B8_00808 [Treponema sp. R8-4-B8]
MLRKVFLFTAVILLTNGVIMAQDFGFGSDDDEDTPKSSAAFTVGGEISAEAIPYIYDLNDEETFIDSLWNVKLNLEFTSPYIDIFSILNFNSPSINELWTWSSNLKEWNYTPLVIDELYFRAYISTVNIEAGFRKLTWGKVDSNGPLDVINPLDYTDLIDITDIRARKIARPMVHITWNAGNFSKLEGVFIPNFTGYRFASEGRWTPIQYSTMMENSKKEISARLINYIKTLPLTDQLILYSQLGSLDLSDYSFEFPDTSGIEYFQAGLRFTTTVSSADLGIQYFYGNLFRPNYCLSSDGVDYFIDDLINGILSNPGSYAGDISLLSPKINYTRYHQIGIDYAQVLFGFNLRAEAAINITEDFSGDDGSLQNPFIAWALGFDRELFWGINVNAQCDETIRLLDDKVGDNPVFDSEAGTNITSTRLSVFLYKNFFRDRLETGITCVWKIEDADFYIIPSIAWTDGNLTARLAAGIFTGNKKGELGQYWENSFVKLAMSIVF